MTERKTVLIEAYVTGKAGSDAGTAEMWIAAASSLETVEKVFILTANERQAKNPKEEIIYVEKPSKIDDSLQGAFKLLPLSIRAKLGHWSYDYFAYLQWLGQSRRSALELARRHKIDLALHAVYSSLIFGTELGILRQLGVTTVMCGTWPSSVPATYMPLLPASDRGFLALEPLLLQLTAGRRLVDVLACANQQSCSRMQKVHSTSRVCLVHEPSPAFQGLPKKEQIFFVDSPHMPRKGGHILRDYLKQMGPPPMKLRIVSPAIGDFSGIANVEASSWLSEDDFQREVASSRFVLLTSLREGLGTTLAGGASAGCIPIVTPIAAFDAIPKDACIKLSADMQPVAALAAALEHASKIEPQELARMAECASSWAQAVTDPGRLQRLLSDWLQLNCRRLP